MISLLCREFYLWVNNYIIGRNIQVVKNASQTMNAYVTWLDYIIHIIFVPCQQSFLFNL